MHKEPNMRIKVTTEQEKRFILIWAFFGVPEEDLPSYELKVRSSGKRKL